MLRRPALMKPGPPARRSAPWRDCRWRSRTTSAPKVFAPPVPAACSSSSCRPTNPRSPSGSGRPVVCWWARQIWMSSPWVAQPKRPRSGPHRTPGTPPMCRVEAPVAVQRPSPPAVASLRLVPTPVAPSANRRRSVVWWASSPPTAASAVGAWWPSPALWIRWDPSPAALLMWLNCSR